MEVRGAGEHEVREGVAGGGEAVVLAVAGREAGQPGGVLCLPFPDLGQSEARLLDPNLGHEVVDTVQQLSLAVSDAVNTPVIRLGQTRAPGGNK